MNVIPGNKVDYLHIDESNQSQEIWEDDRGKNQMYMGKDEILTNSIMLTIRIDLRFSHYVDLVFGVDILSYGFDGPYFLSMMQRQTLQKMMRFINRK